MNDYQYRSLSLSFAVSGIYMNLRRPDLLTTIANEEQVAATQARGEEFTSLPQALGNLSTRSRTNLLKGLEQLQEETLTQLGNYDSDRTAIPILKAILSDEYKAKRFIKYCEILEIASNLNERTGGLVIENIVTPFDIDDPETIKAHLLHFEALYEHNQIDVIYNDIKDLNDLVLRTHEDFITRFKNPQKIGFFEGIHRHLNGYVKEEEDRLANTTYWNHFTPVKGTPDNDLFSDINKRKHETPEDALEASVLYLKIPELESKIDGLREGGKRMKGKGKSNDVALSS